MPTFDSFVLLSIFSAGVLSFASPCVLPLLPVYAAILTDAPDKGIRHVLLNCACFLGGFTLVFMLLGAGASYLGQLFFTHKPLLQKIGALFIILMGLQMSGVFKMPFLEREYRPLLRGKFHGAAGSFGLGIALALGWTPCVGPALAGVLAYTASAATFQTGLSLLFVYALGFCLPFLIGAATVNAWLPKYQKFFVYLPQIQRLFGILFVITGLLLYFDLVTKMIGILWRLFS